MVYALYEKRGRGVGNGGTNMKVTHITLPASDEQLAQLEIGSIVYLSGVVYTAREGVYKKIIEEGEQLPLDNLSQRSEERRVGREDSCRGGGRRDTGTKYETSQRC